MLFRAKGELGKGKKKVQGSKISAKKPSSPQVTMNRQKMEVGPKEKGTKKEDPWKEGALL